MPIEMIAVLTIAAVIIVAVWFEHSWVVTIWNMDHLPKDGPLRESVYTRYVEPTAKWLVVGIGTPYLLFAAVALVLVYFAGPILDLL